MFDLYVVEIYRHGLWYRYDTCAMREEARLVAYRLRCAGQQVRVTYRGEVLDG